MSLESYVFNHKDIEAPKKINKSGGNTQRKITATEQQSKPLTQNHPSTEDLNHRFKLFPCI